MKRKVFEQTCICIIIVLVLLISKNSNIPVLEKGSSAIIAYMKTNYTVEDIRSAAQKGSVVITSLPGKVSGAVAVMRGKPTLAEPIDEEFDGEQAAVHAVAGGEVIAVGENEEIGKYIRIVHDGIGESLYGNLKSVYIEVPARVKKGQIIGIYQRREDKEFYYSFKEFN